MSESTSKVSKASADLRKLAAETVKLEAENVHAEALRALELELKRVEIAQKQGEVHKQEVELKRQEADLRKALADAEAEELVLQETKDNEKNRQAANFFHRVYRFTTPVSETSVAACISTLDKWHRLDPGAAFEIIFSSPGGSVIDGLALVDHIRSLSRDGHFITIGAEGWAASMAGILLQAGDRRWIGKESWLLIHEISAGAFGNISEMEDRVAWLKRIQERVIKMFLGRAADAIGAENVMSVQKFKESWKKTDWFLDSDQAMELGFVDEVR
jgi:ATP-dependent protease ClpP protease subunit